MVAASFHGELCFQAVLYQDAMKREEKIIHESIRNYTKEPVVSCEFVDRLLPLI